MKSDNYIAEMFPQRYDLFFSNLVSHAAEEVVSLYWGFMRNFIIILVILIFTAPLFPVEYKTIHIIVALCDNENQGIVPVSKKLGDGKNPNTNLYWGALYGVKTTFKKSSSWKLIKQYKNLNTKIAERVIFKHHNSHTFLIADAYYGDKIKDAIIDIIHSGYGEKNEMLKIHYNSKDIELGIYGESDLLTYAGHNGLMELEYHYNSKIKDEKVRDLILLACSTQRYFKEQFYNTKVNPILVTTGLMAPEAYTLESVFEGWILSETKEELLLRAAKAYSKYQKCSLKAAEKLFDHKWH